MPEFADRSLLTIGRSTEHHRFFDCLNFAFTGKLMHGERMVREKVWNLDHQQTAKLTDVQVWDPSLHCSREHLDIGLEV